MDAVLIENPTASSVTPASRRVAERALAATFDLELVTTEAREHATQLAAEAVATGAKTLIAFGGDGTVNEVVNGIARAGGGATLAVLPGGGTNVLARSLGYPNDLVEATDRLIDAVDAGSIRDIRVGRLVARGPEIDLDRLFTFGAGIALDGGTVRRVEASGLRPRLGDLAFVYGTLRSFVALRRVGEPTLTVETADGPVEAWWASFGKADPFTYLGRRPFRVHPEVRHDGPLHVAAGLSAGYLRTSRWVVQALRSGKQTGHRDYLYLRDVPSVDVSASTPMPLQCDGEYLGEVSEVRVESVGQRLAVWA